VHTDRRGERLREFAHSLEGRRRDKVASGSGARSGALALELEQASVVVEGATLAEAPATLGPFSARLALDSTSAGPRIDATLRLQGGRVRVSGTKEDFRAEVSSFPLAPLAAAFGPRALEVQDGLADGKVTLQSGEHGAATARFDLGASNLVVQSERLASEPVGPAEARLVGAVQLDRESKSVALDGAKLLLGPEKLEVPLEASLDLGTELRFQVDARIGPVNLQKVVAALPTQLQPGPTAPHLDGPVRAELRVGGPLRHVPDWNAEVRLDTAALKAAGREAPFPLREALSYTPQEQDGKPRTLWLGERNPNFVPLSALPPVVPAAVVASEDGAFFTHNGFDFDELRDAFVSAEEGTRLRGGSTLTQQLVKNVYLTRERTLARKLREALITIQVEAALPKARILELYLNLIEWGPGVYGIGEAAHSYFGIDARQLDARQAVFLTSIIPGPKRFGPYFRRHPISDTWQKRMDRLLDVLHERGSLTDEEYQRALAEPVTLHSEH
jgi:hypothetical protein